VTKNIPTLMKFIIVFFANIFIINMVKKKNAIGFKNEVSIQYIMIIEKRIISGIFLRIGFVICIYN